jgi:hypothetical protein
MSKRLGLGLRHQRHDAELVEQIERWVVQLGAAKMSPHLVAAVAQRRQEGRRQGRQTGHEDPRAA